MAGERRRALRSTAWNASLLDDDVIVLERADRLAELRRNGPRLPLVEIDEDGGLRPGDHEHVVACAVARELVGRARATDACDADEDLDLVVEDGRRVVLDRASAHDELDAGLAD